MDIQSNVRHFIEGELHRDVSGVTDADSLLEAGVLDSLGVMALVAFIERQYAIGVTEDEMMPENFDTIEAIAAFVARRRTGHGDAA